MTSGDYYNTVERNIEVMGRDLEGLTYNDVPMFHFLKMTTYLHMRNRYVNQQGARWQRWKSLAWQVVRQLWRAHRTDPVERFVSTGADFIVVLDHDQPNFVALMLRIAGELGENSVFMLTTCRRIAAEVKGAFTGPCYVPSLERTLKIKLEHLRLLAAVYGKTPLFRKAGVFFTLSCFFDTLTTLKIFDFYRAHLNPAKTKAVVTLCDAHPHEAAISKAATGKGIPAFTLQHGITGVMHTPVHSDRIFVWGETTKQDLLRLGVPEEKIVISGRPLLDEAAAKCTAMAPSLRASFRTRHPRADSSGPVVTYIAGNIDEGGERTLFTAFSASWSLGILPVVRLKPTIDKAHEQRFRDWINDLGGASEVYVSTTDDLYELLAVSDVVIGFHSSVVVEALAFGCIPVLLDALPEYDLRAINSHYEDCLIAHDAEGLCGLIRRMTEDANYFQQLKDVYAETGGRYFGGEPGVPATRFIRDYIVNFGSRQVQ